MERGSVVGSWLLDLTADVLRHDHDDLNKFAGGVAILVKVVGLFMLLWILVYPLLLSLPPSLKDLILEDLEGMPTKY